MEAFYTYVKATICKLIGFTCIVAAVLLLGGWWQYISGWCIGSGLNIVYFFMLSSRSVRALKLPPAQAAESQQAYDDYASGSNSQPGTSGLPGRHRDLAVPVHFTGSCRGRYLFIPRPDLCRCVDRTLQTVKERRYCVWNYMQGIMWSFSFWV